MVPWDSFVQGACVRARVCAVVLASLFWCAVAVRMWELTATNIKKSLCKSRATAARGCVVLPCGVCESAFYSPRTLVSGSVGDCLLVLFLSPTCSSTTTNPPSINLLFFSLPCASLASRAACLMFFFTRIGQIPATSTLCSHMLRHYFSAMSCNPLIPRTRDPNPLFYSTSM